MSYFFVEHVIVIMLLGGSCLRPTNADFREALASKLPTIGISVLVRNKAHTLPYFLSSIADQTYPKDRLYVRFLLDHSSDESIDILKYWERQFGLEYGDVLVEADAGGPAPCAAAPTTACRSAAELREDSFNFARKKRADYVFTVDADVVLTEPDTLKILINERLPIVAPMLLSQDGYSNFWCGTSPEAAYERCEEHEALLERQPELRGCRRVRTVRAAVLLALRHARAAVADDDADDADGTDVPEYVCNTHEFGFVPRPPGCGQGAALERENFLNVKLEAIARGAPLPLRPQLRRFVTHPAPDTLGLDKIYTINLERRPERRRLMEASFRELGLDVEVFPAVDAMTLNWNDLSELNVTLMPGYEDPYHKRPIKAGEIACMLSHYKIWETIAARGYALTMVLEDDVRFAPYFRRRLAGLLRELAHHRYDLLYLGRKPLLERAERPASAHAARPLYSYWTLGYVLSAAGARKLLAGRPLQNLLPVDEYLPVMFDRHPVAAWRERFPVRDVRALSAAPLLVSPVLYVGMPGYVSDTEDSPVVGTGPRREL